MGILNMHLIGKNLISCLHKQNDSLDKWVSAWVSEIIQAHWWCPADVFSQFPKAQINGNDLFLFDTEPKFYGIEVQFAFPQGIALITSLKKHNYE
jgi:mRNA-degrading endonuclease HigB of HigAB toxin-antitoxin module